MRSGVIGVTAVGVMLALAITVAQGQHRFIPLSVIEQTTGIRLDTNNIGYDLVELVPIENGVACLARGSVLFLRFDTEQWVELSTESRGHPQSVRQRDPGASPDFLRGVTDGEGKAMLVRILHLPLLPDTVLLRYDVATGRWSRVRLHPSDTVYYPVWERPWIAGSDVLPLPRGEERMWIEERRLVREESERVKVYEPRGRLYRLRSGSDTLEVTATIPYSGLFTVPMVAGAPVPAPDGWCYAPTQDVHLRLIRYRFAQSAGETDSMEFVFPQSGIRQVPSYLPAFPLYWVRDNSFYMVVGGGGGQSIVRYNVFTGHCEPLNPPPTNSKGNSFYIWELAGVRRGDTLFVHGYRVPEDTVDRRLILRIFLDSDTMRYEPYIDLNQLFPQLPRWRWSTVPPLVHDGKRFIFYHGGWERTGRQRQWAGLYIIDQAALSVPHLGRKEAVVAYPNPVPRGTEVVVRLPEHILPDCKQVEVVDALGRRVPVSCRVESSQIRFATENVAAGTYWLVVRADRSAYVQMVVIQ